MWEFFFGWVVGAVSNAPLRQYTPEEAERIRQIDADINRSISSQLPMTNFINLSCGMPRMAKAVGQNAVVTVKDGIAYSENWTTKG